MPQLIDLGPKCLDVLETAVHGGKAHIPDFVQVAQLFHDHVPNAARRDLALAEAAQPVTDAGHGILDRFAAHGTFLERFLNAAAQLVLVERLAAAIALDDRRQQQLRLFEGREALRARQAFAPSTDLAPLSRKARIDDFSLRVAAEWTIHRGS